MSKSDKMAGSSKVRRGMDIRNEAGDKMNQVGNKMGRMIAIFWILGLVLFFNEVQSRGRKLGFITCTVASLGINRILMWKGPFSF